MIRPRPTGEFPVVPAAADARERLRILVVDDEASVRVALQRYLDGRGHETHTTAHGRDALRLLKESAYDAIIVDMRMPDVSGEQLYDELCAKDPEHASRVIFTTGDVMNEQMRSFLASSGRPLIAKPFELSAFDQVLPAARRAQ